ncbi:GAF sensor signal transduction histidine kinase [Oscillochloris trichoides DG-6]|uniref:Oxygen sensor histidine kinase NreB n=1 Tax=Oscillochloris trichoides DG-6 TaxID=765420 RepID=E1IEG1_9CHLR|nr:GAF domain-containing protein [Oscillochloris trichoides]EFO80487.1 GAF sensor signal transduction histidine kinase [Oscillochloris trichoides DG-6]
MSPSGAARNEGNRQLPLSDLLALGSQIRTDDTPESILHEVAETLRRVVASPQVYVRLRHVESDAFEAAAFAGVSAEVEARLRAEPVLPGTYPSLLRPELRLSDSFLLPPGSPAPNAADAAAAPPDTATLLVPLRGRGDRLIGVIYSAISNPSILDQAAAHVMEAIARQAALAVENVRLAERSARLLAKEQLLAELGRDVSATLDLHAILSRTVERLALAFGSGSLCLIEPDGALVVAAAAPDDVNLIGQRLAVGQGMVGWVAQQGRSFFTADAASDPSLAPLHPAYHACIVAPLRSGGRVIGTLNVGSPNSAAFSFEDVDLLEAIAAQVGGPITGAQLYHESQRLAAHIQRHADQLAVLNTIARTASATLEQETSLPEVTAQIRNGFGYDQVDIFLVDDETNELVIAASCGILPPMDGNYRQHINLGLIGRAARSGQTVRVDDVHAEPGYFSVAERSSTRAELCVPIMASGRTLGLINLESPHLHGFQDEDVAILETIADVLAGTLENARLYRRAQAAAVLEERNRLARELHDSVSQQLFSMTLTAQAARTQLEKNPQRVALQLERLQETATAALAEMRALIFQLRPPALRDQGLVAALQQHAQALSRREGLAIALRVVGDDRLARGLEQPLFRIVQEALNNVVKHANARNVAVALEFGSERILLRVSDDGQGFDPEATPSGRGRHLGMISMRERAAEIGGTMDLRSMIGGGTEVIVSVPRAGRAE